MAGAAAISLFVLAVCALILVGFAFRDRGPGRRDAYAAAATASVPDIAALEALDPGRLGGGATAICAGYRAPGDGGGGVFAWIPAATEPEDGVIAFASSRTGSGRWVRQFWGARLSPEMAGAIGDGTHDDSDAFARLIALSNRSGAFTIALSPGRRYYLARTLDLSEGAAGLSLAGPASARSHGEKGFAAFGARIELAASNGATIKLGVGQTVRDLLVWRHGLPEAPQSLADLRRQVATWYAEDGGRKPLSVAITVPYAEATIDGVLIIGFHTGIAVTGSRFRIANASIDTAGAAVEVSGSRDTSLIENVQARAFWGTAIPDSDAWGDHSYRPGTAFSIHGGADGLQINSAMAIGWVNGFVFAGDRSGEDWLISLLQPNIETPENDGKPTAGIKTLGDVRRLTIVDPRIVTGGPGAALDFGQNDRDPAAAANDNVTVVGGTLEVGSSGNAVRMRAGSTGSIIGTTMNLTNDKATGPLVSAEAGAGRWAIVAPRLSGLTGDPWISIDPSAASNIDVEDVFPDPAAPAGETVQNRGTSRQWHVWDSAIGTTDGSPAAVETVETLAKGAGAAPLVSYRRGGAELGRIVAGSGWLTLVLPHLPTSPAGLPKGALWNDRGVLAVTP